MVDFSSGMCYNITEYKKFAKGVDVWMSVAYNLLDRQTDRQTDNKSVPFAYHFYCV